MTDWREAAAARRKAIVPQVKTAKIAKSAHHDEGREDFGSSDNFGTTHCGKAEGFGAPSSAPDATEHTAITGEGGRFEEVEADNPDADRHGVERTAELAMRYAEAIGADLDRLPQPCSARGYRLLNYTRLFLRFPQFEQSLKLGWSLEELFGIGPTNSLECPEALGLIPAMAFPLWPPRLEGIDRDHAMVHTRSGKQLFI